MTEFDPQRFSARATFLIFALATILPESARAQSFFDQFIDPRDGMLDGSEWLAGRTGFLPVPVILSDPTFGYGGGLALAFFHEQDAEDLDADDAPRDIYGDPMLSLPPSVSAVIGAATANGSWLAGGGHFGSYFQDSLRYEGILGVASINYGFHGIGDDNQLNKNSTGVDIDGFFTSHELKYRLPETDFFVGARYSFLSADIDFENSLSVAGKSGFNAEEQTAGLTAIVQYDDRDNTFSPSAGHNLKLEAGWFGKALGGEANYWKGRLRDTSYFGLTDDIVLGIKVDVATTGGDVPFYELPAIRLRGIGSQRYQDDGAASSELELRYDLDERWSLVGFGGVGATFGSDNDGYLEAAGGGGFRYLIARRMGLRIGVDVARGPEDTVVYLQVGSAWAL